MNFHQPKAANAAEIIDQARKGPRPFDLMRRAGVIDDRRWLAGEFIRRRHARGWQADGADVTSLQTLVAREARASLAATEAKVGGDGWRILVSIAIEGSSLASCRFQAPNFKANVADAVLLDRLIHALDVIAFEIDDLRRDGPGAS